MMITKERSMIDKDNRVFVYYNLHRECWSVRQGGKIVDHTHSIMLKDCRYLVGKAGRKRVLREKRKNVHAFVHGYIHPHFIGLDFDPEPIDGWRKAWTNLPEYQMREIRYNPYDKASFTYKDDASPAWFASYARFDEKRLLIA